LQTAPYLKTLNIIPVFEYPPVTECFELRGETFGDEWILG